ncbi:hypothetical protein, partial [Mycobacterium avium]|uniref:hypothetical protein n=1 Tax=Mycobacterium avium TaxID=1764 RepID=UPI0012DA2AD4
MPGPSPATSPQTPQHIPPPVLVGPRPPRPRRRRPGRSAGYAAAVNDLAFAGAAAQARMLANGDLSAPELLE